MSKNLTYEEIVKAVEKEMAKESETLSHLKIHVWNKQCRLTNDEEQEKRIYGLSVERTSDF